jgi:hypothetical protein
LWVRLYQFFKKVKKIKIYKYDWRLFMACGLTLLTDVSGYKCSNSSLNYQVDLGDSVVSQISYSGVGTSTTPSTASVYTVTIPANTVSVSTATPSSTGTPITETITVTAGPCTGQTINVNITYKNNPSISLLNTPGLPTYSSEDCWLTVDFAITDEGTHNDPVHITTISAYDDPLTGLNPDYEGWFPNIPTNTDINLMSTNGNQKNYQYYHQVPCFRDSTYDISYTDVCNNTVSISGGPFHCCCCPTIDPNC